MEIGVTRQTPVEPVFRGPSGLLASALFGTGSKPIGALFGPRLLVRIQAFPKFCAPISQ